MPAKLKTRPVSPNAPVYPEAAFSEKSNDKGAIRISAGTISSIVRHAACSVNGVTRISGNSLVDNIAEFVGSKKVLDRAIQIAFRQSEVSVELSICICYGFTLPEIAANVQRAVANQIENLTGLTVSQVNVIIRQIEEMEEISGDDESEVE